MKQFWILSALLAVVPQLPGAEPQKYNVLFIMADDLRPELGCFGAPVKSPNIDALANRGTAFSRGYCQQAVCNPSRVSILSSRRLDTLQIYDLPTNLRKKHPNIVTLPQYFKEQGYYTERVGKIFHVGHGNTDDPTSWSANRNWKQAPRFGPDGQKLLNKLVQDAMAKNPGVKRSDLKVRGLPYEAPDVADDQLADGSIATNAIKIMNEVQDKPFFLAVGFLNPHLPFVAPKKYWDLYDPASIELATNPQAPEGAPKYAPHTSGELRAYHNIPAKGPLSDEQARHMIHGYRAAVSYMDAQVGRLLAELDRLKLRDKTIVVLLGDHGWFLGEHGMWCKHANYEEATRTPLIISIPGQKSVKSNALVEFIDIYPSLVEACGLPKRDDLEGTSFLPLVKNPTQPWKQAAFHLYPRQIPGQGAGMGRAIRTDQFRLVEWTARGKDFVEYELYDLKNDPGENKNLAKDPQFEKQLLELRKLLHAGPTKWGVSKIQ